MSRINEEPCGIRLEKAKNKGIRFTLGLINYARRFVLAAVCSSGALSQVSGWHVSKKDSMQ
jgi:hypothetical protein